MFTKKLEKCCNGGNQHNFQPRYTEESNITGLKEIGSIGSEQLRRLLVRQVYVGDICKWCGETVKFEDKK